MTPARPPRLHSKASSRPSGGSGVLRWLKRLFLLGLAAVLAVVGLGIATYVYFDRDLPSVESLRNYRPPQVTKVLCEDGTLCAEYYRERRTLIDAKTLPAHVKNAFLAAEDAEFYHHKGLDYFGMARAALKVFKPGGHMTGASTITQQACRGLLLTQERKLSRKIREWILTPRMEDALSKDEILNLYLNQIYFGQGRSGIEEAAYYYFGKHAKELSVGEAASLAGTVQSPERINPVTNMVRAKRRQQYVLGQLAKHGFLTEKVVKAEMDKPILLAPRPPAQVGPYYIEEIRRMLVARYGDDAVLSGGMRVQIAMRPRLQALADEALRTGLETLDHRMGYRGPLGNLDAKRFATFKGLLGTRISEAGKRARDETLVADLSKLGEGQRGPEAAPKDAAEEGVEEKPDAADEENPEAPSAEQVAARRVPLVPLKEGLKLGGYVVKVEDDKRRARVELVGRQAEIAFDTLGWARPRGVGKWTASPTRMSQVLKVGDIVRVRVLKLTPGTGPVVATLDQIPEVQGALTVIDPVNRHVVALAGGYDFNLSSFNRATQAKRQPGSSFKPFLYAAALASQKFTTMSLVNDAPDPIRDPYTGKVWKPQNFEKNSYDGPITIRRAITLSKNTVSVRLAEALTPPVVIDFAKKAGVHSEMPVNYTLALGTGEVSQLEIANAYTTFDSLGKYADPILLVKVTDARGTVLEAHEAAFDETLPPPVAYLATSLMRSVVEEGTAMQVKELNRPAAGKTGTASEYRDAWFTGYTPDLVASAWVGFDNHGPLGSGETGGKAALPIWLAFMKGALADVPSRDFDVPPGIALVSIDPQSGLLAGASVPGRAEPFLEGTAPTQEAPPPGTMDEQNFFKAGSGKGGL